MIQCPRCKINHPDGVRTCPECGTLLQAPPRPGNPDAIKFMAVLQHLPADIVTQYRGGLILSNLNDLMNKNDQVFLSTLACEEKTVRVTLEVDS